MTELTNSNVCFHGFYRNWWWSWTASKMTKLNPFWHLSSKRDKIYGKIYVIQFDFLIEISDQTDFLYDDGKEPTENLRSKQGRKHPGIAFNRTRRENAFDLMYFSLTVSAVAFHYFPELRTDLNSYCLWICTYSTSLRLAVIKRYFYSSFLGSTKRLLFTHFLC